VSRDLLLVIGIFGGLGLGVLALWRLFTGPLTTLGVKAMPDAAKAWGYKTAWLAMRSSSSQDVARALVTCGLAKGNPAPCNWDSGWKRAMRAGRWMFVTPPLQGHVFVLECWVADADMSGKLAKLSATLGTTVYAFLSHRGVTAAGWVVAEAGAVRRAWVVTDGEVVLQQGEPTAEEKALKLDFAAEPEDEDSEEAWAAVRSESTVVELARRWTVDPTKLEGKGGPTAGFLVRRG